VFYRWCALCIRSVVMVVYIMCMVLCSTGGVLCVFVV
jgi:hypothetical protein